MKIIDALKMLWLGDYIVRAKFDGIETITATHKSGRIVKYLGSGTVWHILPHMKRCNSFMERELSQINKYVRYWHGEYPDAHDRIENQMRTK